MAKTDSKADKKADKRTKKSIGKVDKKTKTKTPKSVLNPTPISSSEIIKAASKVKAKVSAKTPAKTPAKISVKVAQPDDSEESSESASEDEKHTAVINGKAKTVSSESDSDSDSDEDEKPKAAQLKAPAVKPTSSSSDDSDSDSDSDSRPSKLIVKKDIPSKLPVTEKQTPSDGSDSDSDSNSAPSKSAVAPSKKGAAAKPTPTQKPASSSEEDSEDSDSDDDSTPAIPVVKTVATTASDDSDEESDDSSEDDGDTEMADTSTVPVKGKRKAEEESVAPPKKVKLANGDAVAANSSEQETKSIFVGKLSWSVDNDRLAQEFAECGEVVSAQVQVDRNTGKSRGFGYVHFTTADAVQKALAMSGTEIDGRAINVDVSTPPDKSRAREIRSKAFGDTASPPSCTLFIGNLAFSVSEDSLWEVFGEYGDVKSIRLPEDRDTGNKKGFGYVEFSDIESAKKAFEASQGQDIGGRTIRVDYSQPREPGGFGGGRGGDRGFGGGRGGRGGDRGRGGGRGFGGGDRGGRGGRGGFGDRGRGGRGGFGDRGRGRGGNVRSGGITAFEGKKKTF